MRDHVAFLRPLVTKCFFYFIFFFLQKFIYQEPPFMQICGPFPAFSQPNLASRIINNSGHLDKFFFI